MASPKNSITINVKATVKGERTRKLRWWIGKHLLQIASRLMRTTVTVEVEGAK